MLSLWSYPALVQQHFEWTGADLLCSSADQRGQRYNSLACLLLKNASMCLCCSEREMASLCRCSSNDSWLCGYSALIIMAAQQNVRNSMTVTLFYWCISHLIMKKTTILHCLHNIEYKLQYSGVFLTQKTDRGSDSTCWAHSVVCSCSCQAI